MWETPFKSGELLMEQTPSQPETLVGGTPLLLSILVTVFVILALLLISNLTDSENSQAVREARKKRKAKRKEVTP